MVEDEFFRQLANGELADGGPRQHHVEASPSPRQKPRASAQDAAQARPGGRRAFGPSRREPPVANIAPPARKRLAPLGLLAAALACTALAIGGLPREGENDGPAAGGARSAGNEQAARLYVRWTDGSSGGTHTARWRAGGQAELSGRLEGAHGQALADVSVAVLAADARRPRRGRQPIGRLRTGRDGRFRTAVALDRGAAEKTVTFLYRHRGARAAATLRLRVGGFISARPSGPRARRGRTLTLKGRTVPGAFVELELRQPGERRWRQHGSGRAAPSGRWESGLYLPGYAPPGSYRLRARALDPGGLGFLPATGSPLTIAVR